MTSYNRLLTSLRATYNDAVTPQRVTKQEWNQSVKPSLEQAKDLSSEAIDLLKAVAEYTGGGFDSDMQAAAKSWLANDASKFQPGATPGATTQIAQGRNEVFVTATGVFTTDAQGTPPSSLSELGSSLYRAARAVQESFGGPNIFNQAQVTQAVKQGVVDNIVQSMNQDVSALQPNQLRQLRASQATILIALFRSLPATAAGQALKTKAFDQVVGIINDPATPPTTAKLLIAQLQDKDIRGALTPAQKATNEGLLSRIAPKNPLPYTEMQRQAARDGKAVLKIDQCFGTGEGALVGFALELEKDGFSLDSGSLPNGPCVYVKTFPKDHPKNKWGVDFEVRHAIRNYSNDMYKGMSDPEAQWVSYGGHSSFGKNKIKSLRSAPDQAGFKLILTDLCCGSDGMDLEAGRYPGAQNLSSHCSTYYRPSKDPKYGDVIRQSEGIEKMRVMRQGALEMADWETIETRLADSTWYGHPTENNWITPNAWRRRFNELDLDDDGITDLFDVLPDYNSFDVAEDTRREFDLAVTSTPAAKINGRRAFLAVQALNTATNYNPALERVANQRNVVGDPQGIFFDAKAGDKEYVKFKKFDDPQTGKTMIGLQFSSALADASVEALRAVVFYEFAKYLENTGATRLGGKAEGQTMGLLFAAASLEYDMGYRDSEIFDGLKRLYGIDDAISYSDVKTELAKSDTERHNYTGDAAGVRNLRSLWQAAGTWDAFSKAGEPAIAVS